MGPKAKGAKGAAAAAATSDAAAVPPASDVVVDPVAPTGTSAVAAIAAPASSATPVLVLRTKTDLRAITLPSVGVPDAVPIFTEAGAFADCDVAFNGDGSLCAAAAADRVVVFNALTGTKVAAIPEPNVVKCAFSPAGHLVTFRAPSARMEAGNLVVWVVATGAEVMRVVQSKWPAVLWTADGAYCLRVMHGNLATFDGALASPEPLSKLAVELPMAKEPVVLMSPAQPLVCVFVPQHKKEQAMCRVFRMPDIKEDMMVRLLGQADDATLSWSKSASAVLIFAKCDRDRTGQSYYGSSSLYVMSIRERETFPVPLSAGDTVHDCQWSPTADEFIVVHGPMPNNKATLFNARGEPMYAFGEAPRNLVHWAPNGKLLVLGGAGNLAGEFQFYDRTALLPTAAAAGGRPGRTAVSAATAAGSAGGDPTKLGFFSEKNVVYKWSTCSRRLVAANVFGRLRIDNKLVVWSHSGERMAEAKFDELYEASFVPQPITAFVERPLSPVKSTVATAKPQAYRAPHASAAAAALMARPLSATGAAVKPAVPAGPVGATVVVEKKRRR